MVDNVWASLVYCNGTSNKWSCCGQEGNFPTFVDSCYCQDSSPAAFHAPISLNQMASLPYTAPSASSTSALATKAGTVKPNSLSARTSTTTSGATSSLKSQASTVSAEASSTSKPASSSQKSTSENTSDRSTATDDNSVASSSLSKSSSALASASGSASASATASAAQLAASQSSSATAVPATGSSTSMKVGLGVGIAGGVVLITGLIVLAILWRKRKQRGSPDTYANASPDYGIEHKDWKGSDGGAVPTYGSKAELPATQSELSPNIAMTSPSPRTPAPLYQEFNSPRAGDGTVHELSDHAR